MALLFVSRIEEEQQRQQQLVWICICTVKCRAGAIRRYASDNWIAAIVVYISPSAERSRRPLFVRAECGKKGNRTRRSFGRSGRPPGSVAPLFRERSREQWCIVLIRKEVRPRCPRSALLSEPRSFYAEAVARRAVALSSPLPPSLSLSRSLSLLFVSPLSSRGCKFECSNEKAECVWLGIGREQQREDRKKKKKKREKREEKTYRATIVRRSINVC